MLDPAYPGLVVATQARFYSIVRDASPEQQADLLVRSPQFVDASWEYNIRLTPPQDDAHAHVDLVQTSASFDKAGPNPFVALALLSAHRLALDSLGYDAYHGQVHSKKIQLVIVGDNDFYSHRSPQPEGSSAPPPAPSAADLAKLPPFAPLGVPIREVHKTGLGSSAAMTTSVVGALLVCLGLVGRSGPLTAVDRALVHNSAQLAHCSAQGKIGSGFDVSSATWGSQLFRRFTPEVLAPVLLEKSAVRPEGETAPETAPLAPGLLRDTLDPRNKAWVPPSISASTGVSTAVEGLAELGVALQETASNETPTTDVAHQPALIQLPPRIKLVLADVDAGSNTPSLVSRVLAWRNAQPEWAAQMYKVLNASNQGLADTFLALTLEALKDQTKYDRALDLVSTSKSSEVRSLNAFFRH